MFDPRSVRFRGPLVPHVDEFWAELMRQAYAPLSARNQLRVAAHVSRWLDDRGMGVVDLTGDCVERFAAYRRRQGYTHFLTPRACAPLLGYLRRVGAAPSVSPSEAPLDVFVRGYGDYLAGERGLTPSTVRGYTDFARRFAVECRGGARLRWERIGPGDITRYVLQQARRYSVGHAKHVVCSLRSLLRYLHTTGLLRRDLADCVPAVAGWRLAGLPKALEPAQWQRALQGCDPRSAVGRRDAAVFLLLVRLGLRAGDIAALSLDDLDWRAGEIRVRGKGRRESRLPLPRDVGRTLAGYLRKGRPRTSDRRVFLGSRAPFAALSVRGVIAVARSVLARVGITGGAHLLRHTAATQMLRHGASLAEIGHVLRHRHVDTTAIYAKVDFAALRTLAQPWPGGVA